MDTLYEYFWEPSTSLYFLDYVASISLLASMYVILWQPMEIDLGVGGGREGGGFVSFDEEESLNGYSSSILTTFV